MAGGTFLRLQPGVNRVVESKVSAVILNLDVVSLNMTLGAKRLSMTLETLVTLNSSHRRMGILPGNIFMIERHDAIEHLYALMTGITFFGRRRVLSFWGLMTLMTDLL